jgi:hypothetical protein
VFFWSVIWSLAHALRALEIDHLPNGRDSVAPPDQQ